MNSSRTQHVFIVYDPTQVREAEVRVAHGETIVCFDAFAEQMLKQKGVTYLSLRDVIGGREGDEEWWELSLDIAHEWYRVPGMAFLKYKDIKLAEAVEQIMHEYLMRLFYYVRIYKVLKEKYTGAQLTIPTPVVNTAPDAYCLASFMPWAIVDAARMVGFEVRTPEARSASSVHVLRRSTWKERILRAYNTLISVCAPRHSFKVYVSGYRTYFAPIVPYLHDTEIIVWESRGFFDIPLSTVLKHRIRILGSSRGVGAREEKSARAATHTFAGEWLVAREEVRAYLTHVSADLDWSPVLDACEYLVTYAPRVIADINALERIMQREKPNLVLVLASGPHYHFFLMGKIAATCKIPSIELQHASAMIDPRYCRVITDYVATHGANVNMWQERIGRPAERLFAVGSPRFDYEVNDQTFARERGIKLFTSLNLDPSKSTLFVAVPFSDTLFVSPDSYELRAFFQAIREVQRQVPGLQILFKFRSSRHIGNARDYLNSLFKAEYALAGDESVFDLVSASSAAVCNNSTVIYEILIAKRSLILYPWKPFDRYHAAMYEALAPVVYTATDAITRIVHMCTNPAYQTELLGQQQKFLESYSFDGKASPRVAHLLHELAKKK